MTIFKALTIAGSDSGGGAGIQADVKTFQELGVYGMSAITTITAQNTLGVQGVFPSSAEAITMQLDSIGSDLKPDAVKTGMLFSQEIIRIVADKMWQYDWQNLVVDPVMVATGGSPLLQQEAVQSVIRHLLPLALVTTPNLPEAEILTGMSIRTLSDREEAAKVIVQMGSQYVVLKGGHDASTDQVVDVLYDRQNYVYMENIRIETQHTHGTGCTYSAAIAGGITLFEFREKGPGALMGQAKLELAHQLQKVCREHNIPFIVNDDISLAIALDADGVHVGQDDESASVIRKKLGSHAIIGVSAHTVAEAEQAIEHGANYLGIGPIYPTQSKPDAKAVQGTSLIQELRTKGINIPLVGIGGITVHKAATVIKAGADGISVISAIASATSVRDAAALFTHNLYNRSAGY